MVILLRSLLTTELSVRNCERRRNLHQFYIGSHSTKLTDTVCGGYIVQMEEAVKFWVWGIHWGPVASMM